MKGGRRSEVDQVGRMREARQGRREGESWVLWQQWMGEGQRADSRTQELRPRVQARGGGWRDGTKGGRPARASPGILLPPAARCPSPACRRGKKRSLPSIQQSRVECLCIHATASHTTQQASSTSGFPPPRTQWPPSQLRPRAHSSPPSSPLPAHRSSLSAPPDPLSTAFPPSPTCEPPFFLPLFCRSPESSTRCGREF